MTMDKIRTFIALEMPDPVRRELDEISLRLRKELSRMPLSWVPIDNMHLTLKFLGDTDREQISSLVKILQELTSSVTPIELRLQGLGAFPNPKRARVLWVGVELPNSVQQLVSYIESQFVGLGFPREERAFAPHLTLARVRGHAESADLLRIQEVLTGVSPVQGASSIANTVTLFQSELKTSGSVYNPLSKFVLTSRD
jgi:2'-5' RNA ligase